MSLTEKLRKCNLNKLEEVSKQDKINLTDAIIEELEEVGVLTNFEIIKSLKEIIGKDTLPCFYGEAYLSVNNNRYLRFKSGIKTISLHNAALKYTHKKRGLKGIKEIQIRGSESSNIRSVLLFYTNKTKLYSYLSRHLKEKPKIEYQFIDS